MEIPRNKDSNNKYTKPTPFSAEEMVKTVNLLLLNGIFPNPQVGFCFKPSQDSAFVGNGIIWEKFWGGFHQWIEFRVSYVNTIHGLTRVQISYRRSCSRSG